MWRASWGWGSSLCCGGLQCSHEAGGWEDSQGPGVSLGGGQHRGQGTMMSLHLMQDYNVRTTATSPACRACCGPTRPRIWSTQHTRATTRGSGLTNCWVGRARCVVKHLEQITKNGAKHKMAQPFIEVDWKFIIIIMSMLSTKKLTLEQ